MDTQWRSMAWKIRMRQGKYQNYPGIPFKIFQDPFQNNETVGFGKKTIFSSKYCKFVDVWFGW